jgi:hypothetical protein
VLTPIQIFNVFFGYADSAQIEDGYLPASTFPELGFEGQNTIFALFKP